MVSFSNLRERARDSPVISSLPQLSEFYLDDLTIYLSLEEFHADLYDPEHLFETDVIIDADTHHLDYPRVECDEDTVTPRLNDIVDWAANTDHDRLHHELLTQSEIKPYIQNRVTGARLVALIIVDGLSYEAVRQTDLDARPVVVDGITTTEPGYRRVIYGREEVSSVSMYAELLTNREFYEDFAFTYWERGQEDLSTDLHSAMSRIDRVSDFSEAVDTLQSEAPFTDKTYVQITRMGLDQDSHNRKEKPNRDAVVQSIIDDVRALHETVSEVVEKFHVFVTADHGILWRDQLPADPPIVCDEHHSHARYLEDEGNVEGGRVIWDANGTVTTGLKYPYLTRGLNNTEWGVHGGFSYYESIVPLIELTEEDTL